MIRADDMSTPGYITQQVIDFIDRTDVIVAVCTDQNANVFFELGYAWRDHDPILVAHDRNDLPFNVGGYRAVMYGQQLSGGKDWKEQLKDAISAVVNSKSGVSNSKGAGSVVDEKNEDNVVRFELSVEPVNEFDTYRLYVKNVSGLSLYNVEIEIHDVVDRGLLFEETGSSNYRFRRPIAPGVQEVLFLRCYLQPEDRDFTFKLHSMDNKGYTDLNWIDLSLPQPYSSYGRQM